MPPDSKILVVDADAALVELLGEWLTREGYSVAQEAAGANPAGDGFDLILVDVPFPRQGGQEVLKRIAREHPGTPILALSANFFPGVESSGAVARALGVAGVLPKPVTREALASALNSMLKPEQ